MKKDEDGPFIHIVYWSNGERGIQLSEDLCPELRDGMQTIRIYSLIRFLGRENLRKRVGDLYKNDSAAVRYLLERAGETMMSQAEPLRVIGGDYLKLRDGARRAAGNKKAVEYASTFNPKTVREMLVREGYLIELAESGERLSKFRCIYGRREFNELVDEYPD